MEDTLFYYSFLSQDIGKDIRLIILYLAGILKNRFVGLCKQEINELRRENWEGSLLYSSPFDGNIGSTFCLKIQFSLVLRHRL
jgi:hypothetical protein